MRISVSVSVSVSVSRPDRKRVRAESGTHLARGKKRARRGEAKSSSLGMAGITTKDDVSDHSDVGIVGVRNESAFENLRGRSKGWDPND